ncbi:hypothetical protein MXMO3_01776 [Maritalea myrionectae]|uniref:Uncharacterized protein n=1 Tax=Maritalea myrionectae TaxID=454601 RepID=A0A2R4ME38_9HYPH|nr:hypothetical protein MXMO3_01776 [Maritalea myrionectae]
MKQLQYQAKLATTVANLNQSTKKTKPRKLAIQAAIAGLLIIVLLGSFVAGAKLTDTPQVDTASVRFDF